MAESGVKEQREKGRAALEKLRLRQGLPPAFLAEDRDVKLLGDCLWRIMEDWPSEKIRKVRERYLQGMP